MNKPVSLSLSISEVNKEAIYDTEYDYVKLKYNRKTRLSYMDTYSLIIHINTEDFYEDIGKDFEKRFDTQYMI